MDILLDLVKNFKFELTYHKICLRSFKQLRRKDICKKTFLHACNLMYSDIHIYVCACVCVRACVCVCLCACVSESRLTNGCVIARSFTHTHTHTRTPTHNVRKVRSERADWWLPLLLDGQTPTLQIGGDIKKESEKNQSTNVVRCFYLLLQICPRK